MYIPKFLNGLQKALGDNPQLMQLTNQNYIYHIFGGNWTIFGDQKSRKEAIDHIICKKLLKNNSNLEDDT